MLRNLEPGTTYHYRVISEDVNGQKVVSDDYTFTTLDVAPIITNIKPMNITKNSAKIFWDVSKYATGQVEYGETTAYGHFNNKETSFDYNHHEQLLRNLKADTTYHYRVISEDENGQKVISEDHTFMTKTLSNGYGDLGNYTPIAYNNGKQGDQKYIAYYPEGGISADMPVVLFIKGSGANIEGYSGIMQFMASKGYFVIGVDANSFQGWYITGKLEIALNEMKEAHGLNVSKLAIMGHSLGGGQVFHAMKKFRDEGYGNYGSLALSIDGWFSFGMNQIDFNQLDTQVSFIQMNGVQGTGDDPRIKLKIWNLATIAEKSFYTLPSTNHSYVGGNLDNILQKEDLRLMIGALTDDVFNNSSEGKAAIPANNTVSYDDIRNALKNQDAYTGAGNCSGSGGGALDVIQKNDIDYCDIDNNSNKKQLILHPKSHWTYLYPSYYAAHADYIKTLPFSGFVMVGDYYTDKVMRSKLLSYTDIWNEVKVVKDLYPTKSNFLEVRIQFPGDFWNDTAWNNVIANFGTLAKVAKNLGFRGIIYDNEAYNEKNHKMINYKHGNEWYDDDAYKNPNYTFMEHSAKITARFKNIMEAMVSEYPSIDVLCYHSPVEGHIQADTNHAIDNHPVTLHTKERANEWQGAMFTGLKKGLSHQASLHDMGENYKLRTQKHFDDVYQWRKHTIASDATNDVVDATQHWIVPQEERESWVKEVHVDFMVSNQPLEDLLYPEFDTKNKVGLNDMKTTLEHALDKSDKYVVFYSASSANNEGGLIHLDWLEVNDPNAYDDNNVPYSLNPAWKAMVEDVYNNKVLK